jgi:hypothetical protein
MTELSEEESESEEELEELEDSSSSEGNGMRVGSLKGEDEISGKGEETEEG